MSAPPLKRRLTPRSMRHYHTGHAGPLNTGSSPEGLPKLMESPRGRTWNYGWVVVGTFLAIDAMIMGITFSLGLMLPLYPTTST